MQYLCPGMQRFAPVINDWLLTTARMKVIVERSNPTRGIQRMGMTGPDFADYAAILARALGDRVSHFTTLNEPWNFAIVGHLMGTHPPGKHNPWLAMKVVHHSILAHAEAQGAIKAERPEAQVGIALSVSPKIPATASRRDPDGPIAAAVGLSVQSALA